jgi:ABC-2 type transport system ATP-binding protein
VSPSPTAASGLARAGPAQQNAAEINRRLVEAGIAVYGVRLVQTSLEDWFLSVTGHLDTLRG